MHDGYEANGWIEFCSGGILRTSFEKKDAKQDVWCYTTNGNIIATFGNCHHYLQLVDYGKPEFFVFNRILLNGFPARGQCNARGRLATLTPHPPPYAPPSSLRASYLDVSILAEYSRREESKFHRLSCDRLQRKCQFVVSDVLKMKDTDAFRFLCIFLLVTYFLFQSKYKWSLGS